MLGVGSRGKTGNSNPLSSKNEDAQCLSAFQDLQNLEALVLPRKPHMDGSIKTAWSQKSIIQAGFLVCSSNNEDLKDLTCQ